MPVTIDQLTVADEPAAWSALDFTVDGDTCTVGAVRIRLAGRRVRTASRDAAAQASSAGSGAAEGGLLGWSLRGIGGTELDGLATERSDGPVPAEAPPHPNGVAAIDHVVAITPDLERTVAALEAAGLELRRIREEPTPAGAPRQAFFRLGATILEVVQEPVEAITRGGGRDRSAFFWGLAFSVPDIDAAVARLGDRIGEIRPAIQPGRQIATLRRAAGLALPVAMITPAPYGG